MTATEAWHGMLPKVDPTYRGPLLAMMQAVPQKWTASVLIMNRGQGVTRIETGAVPTSLIQSAFTVLMVGYDRCAHVIKNYHGGLKLNEVPDWEDR